MAPHSFMVICYLPVLTIFLIKEAFWETRHPWPALDTEDANLILLPYMDIIPADFPRAHHPYSTPLPGLANLDPEIYIFWPQQWKYTLPSSVARAPTIKTRSD